MWWQELGYESPVDYWVDPVRFPKAGELQNPEFVRLAMTVMMDDDGIPVTEHLRCCRSCGRMTNIEDTTCSQCGSPA